MGKYSEKTFILNGMEICVRGIDVTKLLHALQVSKKHKRKLRQEQKKARRKNRA